MTTFTNPNDTAGYGTNTGMGPGIPSQGMGRHHHQGGPGGGHQGIMPGQGMGTGQGMTGQGMSGQGMGTGQTHHPNVQNEFASNAPGNNYNNGPGNNHSNGPGNNYNNDPGYNNTTSGHHGIGNTTGVGSGTGGVTGGGGGFTGPTNDTTHGYPGQHNNNAGVGMGGGGTGGGTGASASEKEILGKVERMAGTALCSSSLKAKGLEKEREAQALRAQAAELGQAEGLEAEAATRRQRAVAHGADPQHLGASGPGHRQL